MGEQMGRAVDSLLGVNGANAQNGQSVHERRRVGFAVQDRQHGGGDLVIGDGGVQQPAFAQIQAPAAGIIPPPVLRLAEHALMPLFVPLQPGRQNRQVRQPVAELAHQQKGAVRRPAVI